MLMNNDLAGVQDLLYSVWPEWKVTKQIGHGSYGYVYEIIRDDLASPHKCALKVLQMDSDTAFVPDLRSTDTRVNPRRSSKNGSFSPVYRDSGSIHLQDPCRRRGNTQGSLDPYVNMTASSAEAAEGTSETEEQRAGLEEFVLGVSTEINLMLQLKGDPHIVSIEDYAILRSTGTRTILIRMENLYCVSKISAHYGGIKRKEVISLGIDICEALIHCEQKDILHRDIKPSNIFYNSSAGYKLGDFGISRTMDSIYESMSMSGAGTPQYMAPEVYGGMRYDNTADIYSLGLTLYILLNENVPPFCEMIPGQRDSQRSPNLSSEKRHSANMRRLRGETLPPPAHADSRLAAVISIACNPRPENRYQTAEAFRDALVSCLSNPPHSTSEIKKGGDGSVRTLSPVRTAALIAAVFASACAFLVIGAILFTRIHAIYTDHKRASVVIQWTDESLEKAVIDRCAPADGENFTVGQAEKIETLHLDGCEIYDISSLRYFKNLQTLSLADNHILDLSPLTGLDGLTSLNLEHNALRDITPLGNLTGLQSLNLSRNSIGDISSLGGLDSLESLSLTGTDVKDLSVLEGLPSLSSLDVRQCPVQDAACIYRMKESSSVKIVTADPDMDIPEDALFIDGHSYYVFDADCADWGEVLTYCHERGGYPAVIDSYEENEELYRYMLSLDRTAVLFGYTDRRKEGAWEWEDGRISYFTDWGENDEGEIEPNAATVEEDFAQLDVHMMNGHWNDCAFGHDTRAFLCEWDGFR